MSLKMATNFFSLGYHFEEFRSQVAIRKKKLISRPVHGSETEICDEIGHVTLIVQNFIFVSCGDNVIGEML